MAVVNDYQVAKKLIQLQQSAQSRHLHFGLSFKTVKSLMSRKTCYYTGVVLTDADGPTQRTIDRVDNGRGYVDGNVVACSKRINQLKGDGSLEELLLLIRGIDKHVSRRVPGNSSRKLTKLKKVA